MKRIIGLAAAALLASVVAASAQDAGGPSYDTGTSVEGGTAPTNTVQAARSAKTQAMKAARAARAAKAAAKASAAVDDSSTSHPDTGYSAEAGAGTPNVLRANARRPRG